MLSTTRSSANNLFETDAPEAPRSIHRHPRRAAQQERWAQPEDAMIDLANYTGRELELILSLYGTRRTS